MSGAAPLSAALQSTLEKRLGGKTKALQGYGEFGVEIFFLFFGSPPFLFSFAMS